jgi:ferric-dicitrate binding protein FerR (iron transport regulator)
LSDQAELRELQNRTTVYAGQTIETGDNSGVGLAWRNGGSLRVDENTRVEFKSSGSVYLVSGRIYVDSQIMAAISGGVGAAPNLVIETDYGSVTHLGTQYMTKVNSGTLTVSVREGQVDVNGRYTAHKGQQLKLVGTAQPSVANISSASAEWAWVEAIAPTLDFSGQSTHDFLKWVGRETGHTVVFDSPEAEQLARSGRLVGSIENLDPRAELEIRMRGEDLDVEFDSDRGTINVSAIDTGSSQ